MPVLDWIPPPDPDPWDLDLGLGLPRRAYRLLRLQGFHTVRAIALAIHTGALDFYPPWLREDLEPCFARLRPILVDASQRARAVSAARTARIQALDWSTTVIGRRALARGDGRARCTGYPGPDLRVIHPARRRPPAAPGTSSTPPSSAGLRRWPSRGAATRGLTGFASRSKAPSPGTWIAAGALRPTTRRPAARSEAGHSPSRKSSISSIARYARSRSPPEPAASPRPSVLDTWLDWRPRRDVICSSHPRAAASPPRNWPRPSAIASMASRARRRPRHRAVRGSRARSPELRLVGGRRQVFTRGRQLAVCESDQDFPHGSG